MAFIDKLRAIDREVEQNNSRTHNDPHPIVTHVRGWLEAEAHRFVSAGISGADVELLEEPQLGGWQVRDKGNRHFISEVLSHPKDDRPGTQTRNEHCNLGFAIIEGGQLTGHFVWPVAFDREALPNGMSAKMVRGTLAKHGYLTGTGERHTRALPAALARISAEGQPRQVVRTHSTGGLRYKRQIATTTQPFMKVRTLAIRGLFPRAA